MNIFFAIHLFSTIFMTGLVWFVQIVHYPLMREVSEANFPSFEQQHTQRTSIIVAPVMLLELFSGVAFGYMFPIGSTDLFLINLALLILIWVSTFLIQIPLHGKLTKGFERGTHLRLVNSNWVRTILWTIRSIILIFLLQYF
jgi:hypothetical protein